MASLLVRLCLLLACATALADEGGGVVWSRKGRAKLHCSAAARLLGEGRRALPPHLALQPAGGVGAVSAVGARADVVWWRDGRSLEHAGATLRADAPGEYRCGVKIAAGLVLGVPQLVAIPSMKRFTKEPAAQTVAEGQPAVLGCRFTSTPPALYSWEREGQPLLHGDRYYILSSGDLVIPNVTRADEGSYSCSATNIHMANKTRVSKAAMLSVTSPPPDSPPGLLDIDMTPDVVVDLGRELLLPCLVTGQPRPQVSWRHGSTEDVQDGPVLSAAPVYSVAAVNLTHAGVYKCTVAGHEHLSRSWRVAVTAPARIVRPPESVHRPSAGVVRFHCGAEGAPEPRVLWYKNGQPLQLDGRVKVLKGPGVVDSRQLVIGGAQPSDAGVYQCFAQSTGAPATAWAVLGVAGGTLPPPRGLRCRPAGLHRVRVEWDAVGGAGVIYSVHYAAKEGCPDCKEQTEPVAQTRVELRVGAAPYQVYVRAYQLQGKDVSEPSDKVACRGQGVSVRACTPRRATCVSWSAVPLAARYLLQYRQRGGLNISQVELDKAAEQYDFPDVPESAEYEVRLLVSRSDVPEDQDLSLLPWTALQDLRRPDEDDGTEQDVNPAVPRGLTARASVDSLHISWKCDACKNSTAVFSFIVCYKKADLLNTYRETCINRDTTWAELGELEPGAAYLVRVQAAARGRRGGPFSDTLRAVTLSDSGRTWQVHTEHTSRGVRVWWSAPSAARAAACRVHYSQNLTQPLDQWRQLNVTGDTSVELVDLEPSLKTYVMVSAVSMGVEQHGPVVDVPPRTPPPSQHLTMLGVVAGAAVAAACAAGGGALCVWRHRKQLAGRTQRPATGIEDIGTEMTGRVRGGAGDRRAGEPLLNGHKSGRAAQINPPNGLHPLYDDLTFDLSRGAEDTTLDTVLQLDNTDIHQPPDCQSTHQSDHHSPTRLRKLPDDNMNCRFSSGGGAPTLQPNG